MSGFSVSARAGGRPEPSFLILPPDSAAARQSATAAAITATSAGSAASTASSICRAVSTWTVVTPGGSGIVTGPGDQGHPRPGGCRRLGDGVALAAGGAVGEVAHRVDRLMGRAGGHQHMAAGKDRFHRRQDPFGRGDDLQRFGHAPRPGLSGFGHLAGSRADEMDAVALQRLDVPLCGGMRPHGRVHRRRQQHRNARGKQHGTGKVVRLAARHLRHQVCGRRRHHDQPRLARQADMADVLLVRSVEEFAEDATAGERADRKRRHELLRSFGHHGTHAIAPLLQAADQVERLVGGNAAADDEQDGSGMGGSPVLCWQCSRMLRRCGQGIRLRRGQRAEWRASPLPWRHCARLQPFSDAGAWPRRGRGWSGSERFLPWPQSIT